MEKIVFLLSIALVCCCCKSPQNTHDFEGRYISGSGDTEYLELLDKAYRMLRPDGELENLSMLYHPIAPIPAGSFTGRATDNMPSTTGLMALRQPG